VIAGSEGNGGFASGVSAWRRHLGTVRDVVRQELVARQLEAHILESDDGPLRVLDAGCGQGTQALKLARLGHDVLGVDLCEELLADARRAADDEPPEVRARLRFERADVLALGAELADQFDVVCCHGVLMYLPSLGDAVSALVAVARPGGLLSLLTRNSASLAMRAGMCGDWRAALGAFDADRYTNRLGIDNVRADDPRVVGRALTEVGARTLAWYGVRLFCDHWEAAQPPPDLAMLIAAEEQAGRRDPYRAVAAMTHTVAQRSTFADC
jgi:SAM-dependent methyltransferase